MQSQDIEHVLSMLRLVIRCGASASIEIDDKTSKYLYELIRKDIIENEIPISIDLLKDIGQ